MPSVVDLAVRRAFKRDDVASKDIHVAWVCRPCQQESGNPNAFTDEAVEGLDVRMFLGDPNNAANSRIYCKTMVDCGGGMYRYEAEGGERVPEGEEIPMTVNIRAWGQARNVVFPVVRDNLTGPPPESE